MEDGGAVWQLAAALAGASTPVDVAVAVAEEGAAAAGASFANLAVVGRDGQAWLIHAPTLELTTAERWSTLDLEQSTPITDAITGCSPVLLGRFDDIAARYPSLAADTKTAHLEATASLPLVSADGDALGAMGLGWATPQSFTAEEVRRLAAIAEVVAAALDRTASHELEIEREQAREAEDAQLLQDVFLPRTLPEVAALEVAAVYLPASEAAMGGDWYDVFEHARGTTMLVIGDVAGHGLQAAAVMAHLRNAVRAYAVTDGTPAALMDNLNRMLCRFEPDETATAVVMLWDPMTRTLRWTNAGHLPILRCRPDVVDYVETEAASPLLGADPDGRYEEHSKTMRQDTTLLAFTDGLVEYDRNADVGLAALREMVGELDDLAPGPLCDAVLQWRLDLGALEDDICVLAIRVA